MTTEATPAHPDPEKKKRQRRPRPPVKPAWMSVEDAAKYLGRPKATLYSWLQKKIIDSAKMPGKNGARLIPIDALDAFMRSRMSGGEDA